MISAIAFVVITAGIFYASKKEGISSSGAKSLAGIFAGSFVFSAFISYNRDTLSTPYYALILIAHCILCIAFTV